MDGAEPAFGRARAVGDYPRARDRVGEQVVQAPPRHPGLLGQGDEAGRVGLEERGRELYGGGSGLVLPDGSLVGVLGGGEEPDDGLVEVPGLKSRLGYRGARLHRRFISSGHSMSS